MEFIKFIFSNFWIWLGFFLIVSIPFESIVRIHRNSCRRKNIRERGWPPLHLDADGDFEFKETKEDD